MVLLPLDVSLTPGGDPLPPPQLPYPLGVDLSNLGSEEDRPLKGMKIGVFWPVKAPPLILRSPSFLELFCTICNCSHSTASHYTLWLSIIPNQQHPTKIKPRRSPACVQWFNDCDPDVLSCCRSAVDAAVSLLGSELVEVVVPELELMRVAHSVTIVSEMHHCMQVWGVWGGRDGIG